MPDVLSPMDLVSRPDNMDKTVLHTSQCAAMCGATVQPINFSKSGWAGPHFRI